MADVSFKYKIERYLKNINEKFGLPVGHYLLGVERASSDKEIEAIGQMAYEEGKKTLQERQERQERAANRPNLEERVITITGGSVEVDGNTIIHTDAWGHKSVYSSTQHKINIERGIKVSPLKKKE